MMDRGDLRNLRRKLRKKTSILTGSEVQIVTRQVRKVIGRELLDAVEGYGLRMGDVVRWGSVRARCEEERERRGLTLKDVSLELRIPQYQLRAIEEGRLREFQPEFAQRYFRYLGMESWVKRWVRKNAGLARRAGLRGYVLRRRKDC